MTDKKPYLINKLLIPKRVYGAGCPGSRMRDETVT